MRHLLPIWLATPILNSPGAEEAFELFKTDPFHYFNRNGLATDTAMQEMAGEIYQLLLGVALFVLACSILYATIKWGITPPGKKKEGIISVLSWKFFLVVFIAAFLEIVSIFYAIFDQMAGAV